MHEHRVRTLAKCLSWRLLATLDTVLLALIFTGSLSASLTIGGLEILTKVVWYYAHERAWVSLGKLEPDSLFGKLFRNKPHTRGAAKAITWRGIGAIDTFLISLLVTGHAGISASIGVTELLTKIVIYYFHECFWHHVKWGVDGDTEDRRPEEAIFYGFLTIGSILGGAAIVYFFTTLF